MQFITLIFLNYLFEYLCVRFIIVNRLGFGLGYVDSPRFRTVYENELSIKQESASFVICLFAYPSNN